jgi:two-component system, NtrC family, sensor histidine kinase HydH
LKNFVFDAAATEGVAFLALYDGEYRLLASSPGFDPALQGVSPTEIRDLLRGEGAADFSSTYPGIGTVLVTVTRFAPLDAPWFRLRLLEVPPVPGVTGIEGAAASSNLTRYAVIGISTADLAKSVEESGRQILLYGFLLLLLGTIGFYFLILVQSSYSAQKALENVKQYAIDVVEGMAEGLVNIDHDGVIRTLNPEAERILGLRAAGAVGRPWQEVFAGEGWGDFASFISAGRPFYDRMVPPRGPGLAPLVVTLASVRGQAGRGGLVFFLRDREEVESLRDEVRRSERLAALGRLVAGMAHEIRNPLNSIRGFTQLLSGKFPEGSGESRAAGIIIREVDRLNRVITDLLDFSRPKEVRFSLLDLNEVVRSAVPLVEREGAAGGVKVVEELAPDGVTVRGDGDSLKQALLNLLLNALQAMPDGGVLTLTTRAEEGGAILDVSDTGVGISSADAANIFEPFFTMRQKGTGLGLAIVHRIVQDHGGEIRVRSAPGKGATFTVRFPAPAPGAGGKGSQA